MKEEESRRYKNKKYQIRTKLLIANKCRVNCEFFERRNIEYFNKSCMWSLKTKQNKTK